MPEPRFGVFLSPAAQGLEELEEQVRAAEESGFDYVSVQDHPYVPDFLDTLTLITHLAARTTRIRFMTNVANLPLRPAPMLAKTAASIDVLSGGRFDLGLGGGRAWKEIAGLGGPHWSPGDTVEAVGDAIDTLRTMWRPGRTATVTGGRYPLRDVDTGPAPAHPIGIWLGAGGPRMLDLLGHKADGWIAPMRSDHSSRVAGQDRIDAAARAAGREPRDIERVMQIVGVLDPSAAPLPGTDDVPATFAVRATAEDWARLVTDAVTAQRFDAVNLIPQVGDPEQLRRFAAEVIPRVREAAAS
ncbi:LLM class flavin-dependent oxidoreductase [Pseudonocardia pini]|uniref:LLM class flavin-dependent oxidoreductase n=1 Tax=Pseudonocardia pini TaxID=2758030 RepID=UPI0015F00DCC|nr:LLM class flavin-dependent oxidoreductase [Pseudonocardia pini]